LVVDHDGSAACLADLADEVSYHSGEVNEVSIGIEIYQGSDAELYEGQLESVVALVDYLTRRFHIQRQYQWPYHRRPAARIASGAQDVVGIFGHRDVTTNRGLGDPGDAIRREPLLGDPAVRTTAQTSRIEFAIQAIDIRLEP
jgi:hypothetical protein